MPVKRMARIAILAALCIVLRFAFGPFPNIKPITAFYLVSLSYFPFSDVFLIMALSIIGSGLLMGFSIVVLWQVLSYLILLLIWYCFAIPFMKKLPFAIWIETIFAGVLPFIYGFVISLPIALQFSTKPIVFWLNGLSFDALHGLSTALFYPIIVQLYRRLYQHEKNYFKS